MENSLLVAVLAKFRSISNFARALNWDRKKASRIVNRQQWPTAKDMDEMADALDVHDSETFMHLFLPFIPTKWEVGV